MVERGAREVGDEVEILARRFEDHADVENLALVRAKAGIASERLGYIDRFAPNVIERPHVRRDYRGAAQLLERRSRLLEGRHRGESKRFHGRPV